MLAQYTNFVILKSGFLYSVTMEAADWQGPGSQPCMQMPAASVAAAPQRGSSMEPSKWSRRMVHMSSPVYLRLPKPRMISCALHSLG